MTTDRAPREAGRAGSGHPFELVYAPPSYGMFNSEDDVCFRFLLNGRGWATGLLWCTDLRPGNAARAGIT